MKSQRPKRTQSTTERKTTGSVILFTEPEYTLLKTHAREHGCSVPELIRRAILAHRAARA